MSRAGRFCRGCCRALAAGLAFGIGFWAVLAFALWR
jgi:hypothetical protein